MLTKSFFQPLNNLNKQNPVSSVLKLDKLLKLSTSTTTTESSVKQDGSRSSGRVASLGQPDSPDLGGQDEIIGFLGVEVRTMQRIKNLD